MQETLEKERKKEEKTKWLIEAATPLALIFQLDIVRSATPSWQSKKKEKVNQVHKKVCHVFIIGSDPLKELIFTYVLIVKNTHRPFIANPFILALMLFADPNISHTEQNSNPLWYTVRHRHLTYLKEQVFKIVIWIIKQCFRSSHIRTDLVLLIANLSHRQVTLSLELNENEIGVCFFIPDECAAVPISPSSHWPTVFFPFLYVLSAIILFLTVDLREMNNVIC